MQKVTLSDAKKFHDQFYGANYGVFAVVGPVDAAAMQKTGGGAARRLEHAEGVQAARRAVQEGRSPINEKIETPGQGEREFLAGERFQLSQNDPDYPAIVLAELHVRRADHVAHLGSHPQSRRPELRRQRAHRRCRPKGDAAMLSGTVSLNPGESARRSKPASWTSSKKVYD